MVCLEINAEIASSKILEFNQSKLSFIDELQNIEGYSGFTEKTGKTFQMKIMWTTRQLLTAFMKSEYYRVFHGAIITLSKTETTRIINN